jgi:hypothetical protein
LACETRSHFQTSIFFKFTLVRQIDHAASRGQADRAVLFHDLLGGVDGESS